MSKRKDSQGGTYVIDKATGELVKISDRIPGVAAKGGAPAPEVGGDCGRSACARGGCQGPGGPP